MLVWSWSLECEVGAVVAGLVATLGRVLDVSDESASARSRGIALGWELAGSAASVCVSGA